MEHCYSFVTVPKFSRSVYSWSDELQAIVYERTLDEESYFPADYGLIQGTLGTTGQPLASMTLVSYSTFAGCVIHQRVVGLFRYRMGPNIEEVIVAVPAKDPNWAGVESVADIPDYLVYGMSNLVRLIAGSGARADGWYSKDEGIAAVSHGIERFERSSRRTAKARRLDR